MKNKIGENIVITKDFTIKSFSNKLLNIKKGDKGFIDSRGCIHYTTGEARGKIQKSENTVLEGYDNTNIAKMILKKICGFGLDELFEDYEIEKKELEEEIEDILNIIL